MVMSSKHIKVLTHAVSHAVKEHPRGIIPRATFDKGDIVAGCNADHSKQLQCLTPNLNLMTQLMLLLAVTQVIWVDFEFPWFMVGSLGMAVALEHMTRNQNK